MRTAVKYINSNKNTYTRKVASEVLNAKIKWEWLDIVWFDRNGTEIIRNYFTKVKNLRCN